MLSYPIPVYVLAGSVRCEDLTKLAERRRIAAQLGQTNPPRRGAIWSARRMTSRGLIAVGSLIRGAAPVDAAPERTFTG